jgi:hypothetical protein
MNLHAKTDQLKNFFRSKAVRSSKTPIARIIPNRESQKEFVAFVKFVSRLLSKAKRPGSFLSPAAVN